ncbi:histidine kinase N-terminal 7TM domain-containing protein [Dehalogenimonas sp. 4OHTPN]|uniref:histidine kinase n=1 Tax=Dehalogenimonas sp. 4OHTPN TaxID=3166643 RepID=A0AAU8G6N0_9CHLR
MPPVSPAFILTPYTIVYFLSFVICAIAGGAAWRRRKSAAGYWLSWLMAAASIWCFFGMLEVSATATDVKVLLSKLEYIGGLSVPVLFVIFALSYTGQQRWITRRNISLAFIIPVLTLILTATNEAHSLIWTSFEPGPAGSNLIYYIHGPWFWFSNIGYTSLCVLAGSLLVVRFAFNANKDFQPRTALVVIGAIVPWVMGFLYVFDINPLPAFDLTRVAFSFSGLLFLFAILRWRLLDIMPVAYNVVLDAIPDGMLIIDKHNRIVDFNRAAVMMIEASQPISLGLRLEALISEAPWFAAIAETISTPAGLCLKTPTGRHLEAGVTDLGGEHGSKGNRVIFLKDITEGKAAEQALTRSEELYRSLFENMLNGFSHCRIILEDDLPVDFVYLNVNHTFGELTGLKNVIGKRVTEVIPGIRQTNPELLEIYGRVAATGIPEAFETYLPVLDMWFDISVYSPEPGYFVAVFDVVTERKRFETQLKKAASDWETTFDSITDAIAIIDADHRIVRANRSFAALSGMSGGSLVGRHCYEIIHGTDKPIPGCPHICTLTECRQATAEFPEPALGRHVEVSTSPLLGSGGNCIGSVHIIKDITERKKIETTLQESESRLRSLYNNMAEGVALHHLIFDDSGHPVNYRIIDANLQLERILGIDREAILGKTATEAYGVQEAPYLSEYSEVALSGQPARLETYFPPLDRYFDISIAPWGQQGFATIFTDATERQRAWEAKSRLATIVEFSADAMIGRDLAGRITSWNKAAERIFGYSAEEMLGHTSELLMPDGDITSIDNVLGQIQRSGQSISFETLRNHKDGTVIDVAVTISPVNDTAGKVIGFSSIARDITESKKSAARIKRALEEKELLLKEIHHRVKNNMQVISSLLKMQSRFVSDEPTRQMLRESEERIKSMSLVYNKLYESADLAHINIRDYAQELVHNLSHAYSMSPGIVRISTEITEAAFDLDTAVPIGLIINELVTNSLKYAFPDGRRGEIIVSLKIENSRYSLSVKDNGIGLPEGFDARGGRSLGLRLVTALAEHQLGGKMTVKRDAGTEFSFVFEQGGPNHG